MFYGVISPFILVVPNNFRNKTLAYLIYKNQTMTILQWLWSILKIMLCIVVSFLKHWWLDWGFRGENNVIFVCFSFEFCIQMYSKTLTKKLEGSNDFVKTQDLLGE